MSSAPLYLQAEMLQMEIDSVRTAAQFLSRVAREHDDENLQIASSGLFTLHARLSQRFGDLIAEIRQESDC